MITFYTLRTAPRTLRGLREIGRFPLRQIAKELRMINTEKKISAFLCMSSEQQARAVRACLTQPQRSWPRWRKRRWAELKAPAV